MNRKGISHKKGGMILEALLMLCDSVQVADGKLYILGGGWERTAPTNPNMGLAITILVDWEEREKAHTFSVELQDEAGKPAKIIGMEKPLRVEGEFKVKARPDHPEGIQLSSKHAINLQRLSLKPGSIYRWELRVNGEHMASATFSTGKSNAESSSQ